MLESSINGASGVIVNITGGADMGIHEISDAASIIHDAVLEDATVIIGTAVDERIQNDIQITVIATGFDLKNNSSISQFGAFNSSTGSVTTTTSEPSKINAADFFSGAFNNTNKSILESTPSSTNKGFTNIEIPDFLKR